MVQQKPAKKVRARIALALDRPFSVVSTTVTHAPEWKMPGRLMFSGVILTRDDVATAFDQQHLEPFFGEFLGGPTTGDARSHDNRIKLLLSGCHALQVAENVALRKPVEPACVSGPLRAHGSYLPGTRLSSSSSAAPISLV